MTFRNTRALWYRAENFKDDEGDQTDLTERGASASHTAAAVDLGRDPLFPPAIARRCRLQVMCARFARVPGRGDCLVSWSGVVHFFKKISVLLSYFPHSCGLFCFFFNRNSPPSHLSWWRSISDGRNTGHDDGSNVSVRDICCHDGELRYDRARDARASCRNEG